jgi:hypothetical protein
MSNNQQQNLNKDQKSIIDSFVIKTKKNLAWFVKGLFSPEEILV